GRADVRPSLGAARPARRRGRRMAAAPAPAQPSPPGPARDRIGSRDPSFPLGAPVVASRGAPDRGGGAHQPGAGGPAPACSAPAGLVGRGNRHRGRLRPFHLHAGRGLPAEGPAHGGEGSAEELHRLAPERSHRAGGLRGRGLHAMPADARLQGARFAARSGAHGRDRGRHRHRQRARHGGEPPARVGREEPRGDPDHRWRQQRRQSLPAPGRGDRQGPWDQGLHHPDRQGRARPLPDRNGPVRTHDLRTGRDRREPGAPAADREGDRGDVLRGHGQGVAGARPERRPRQPGEEQDLRRRRKHPLRRMVRALLRPRRAVRADRRRPARNPHAGSAVTGIQTTLLGQHLRILAPLFLWIAPLGLVAGALAALRSWQRQQRVAGLVERAKLEVTALLDRLNGDRVGLVVFAGDAFVQCPLTTDYAAARLFLRAVEPVSMATQGTAIADALYQAREVLDGGGRGDAGKAVLLITDGEDQRGDALAAASDLAEAGIRIFAVPIGSTEGEPIPLLDRAGNLTGYKKDKEGRTVLTRTDIKGLGELAARGNGALLAGGGADLGVLKFLPELERIHKGEFESRLSVQYDDKYPWFAWP